MGRYSRGRRGGPAKAVGRATVARVRIPLFPPKGNCSHPKLKNGCELFFLSDCIGMVIPFENKNNS